MIGDDNEGGAILSDLVYGKMMTKVFFFFLTFFSQGKNKAFKLNA